MSRSCRLCRPRDELVLLQQLDCSSLDLCTLALRELTYNTVTFPISVLISQASLHVTNRFGTLSEK